MWASGLRVRRDDGDLEGDEGAVTSSGQRSAGTPRRKVRRRPVVKDVEGVGAVPNSKGDPQVDVCLDLRGHHPRRALRREDQVDTEGPTESGEPDHPAHELRDLVHQGTQLVHDQDEPGDGLVLRPAAAEVAVEVRHRSRCEDPLPAPQLRAQGGERSRDEVVVEVGHHPDDVGQVRTGAEGRATLEVHEDEGEVRGR